jgi:hypothetical protein
MPFNILNSVAKLPKKLGGVQNLWVAVGDMKNSGKPFYSSPNGKNTWTQGTGGSITITDFVSVAHGKGTWVAVTFDGNQIAYSIDGRVWQGTNAVSYSTGQGVAYGKDNTGADLWVIAGASGSSSLMLWSINGISWNSSGSIGGSGSSAKAVAYGKDASGAGLWVAANDQSVNSIRYSSTGKGNWNTASNSGAVSCIAYGKDASGVGLWLAGSFNILSSANGSSWNTIPYITGGILSITCIAYGKDASGAGLWVAGSQSDPYIGYSSNGNNWYATTSTERNGCQAVNSVAYGIDGSGNGLWLIHGDPASASNRTFFHSVNGKNWTIVPLGDKPTNLNRVRGIAFNNVDL